MNSVVGGELVILFEHYETSEGLRCATHATRKAHAFKGEDIRSRTIAQTARALLSTVSVEDYVHHAPRLVELDRIQGVGHLDMGVALPLNRDD